ncbi:MAG: hypothetical protein FJZ13_04990 [Candidatus Omnitrophica bacterium]|nr:hypothetical protein [Candidatus Omnitrophota bacterium]
MIKKAAVLLFYCSIVLFLGCAGLSRRERPAGSPALLEPQASFKFADIPVPAGFKFLAQDSYSFESSGVRVGVLKYQGKAKPEQVIVFYKEQMPMYNWGLLNIIEYGNRMLNFDRDSETCIINLLPKGNSIVLTISVGPKSQGARRVERPIK